MLSVIGVKKIKMRSIVAVGMKYRKDIYDSNTSVGPRNISNPFILTFRNLASYI